MVDLYAATTILSLSKGLDRSMSVGNRNIGYLSELAAPETLRQAQDGS